MCLNHQFTFYFFMVFHGDGGVGCKFVIYQWMWGIEFSGARILDLIIGGISDGCVGGRGDVDCNVIINFFSFFFFFFVVLVE